MRRLYIGGALFSAILHAPLLKDKEYVAFAAGTLLWPLTSIVWLNYIRYATWSQYKHNDMVKNGKGCYAHVSEN